MGTSLQTRPTVGHGVAPAERTPRLLLGLIAIFGWLALMLALLGTARAAVVLMLLFALNAGAAWFLWRHVGPDSDEDDVVPAGHGTRRPHR